MLGLIQTEHPSLGLRDTKYRAKPQIEHSRLGPPIFQLTALKALQNNTPRSNSSFSIGSTTGRFFGCRLSKFALFNSV